LVTIVTSHALAAAGWVAQLADPPYGDQARVLDGVLGLWSVAEDPDGDREPHRR
jgi:hypothetical protein